MRNKQEETKEGLEWRGSEEGRAGMVMGEMKGRVEVRRRSRKEKWRRGRKRSTWGKRRREEKSR